MRWTTSVHLVRLTALGLLALATLAGCRPFGQVAATTTPPPTRTAPPTATSTTTPVPTATSTPAPYVPPWPILRRGDGGSPEVFALQRLLRFRGRIVVADGRFGAQTFAAVQAVQIELGEPVDGLVGPVTWSALVEGLTLRQGDTGEAVKAAQYLINKFRAPVTVDGEFGPNDLAALSVFKVAVGLQPDAVIDAITWQALAAFKPSVEPSLSYP
ncbi:MAG TPA: peptidoglycan-binding protein [Anaerolineales bacterium]|nr:peptidoglycan-binding protein [Anaerolineales bacterium]